MATRVIITGIDKFTSREFQTIQKLSQRQLRDIAVVTETVIRRKIKESLQRPGSTGNLANSFFAEPIGVRGWGVGNIGFLNQNAKYWRWINFGVAGTGRKVPPASKGSFSPPPRGPDGGAFRTGRFQNDGSFLMIPEKAIEPHNYIQRTLDEVPKIISISLNRIRR